jgi:excisionase family DNA binding protein
MTLDDSLRAAVAEATAPLEKKLDAIMARLEATVPAQWISREEACRRLGCGLWKLDRLIREEAIRSRRVGARVMIDAGSLQPPTQQEVDAEVWRARKAAR